jgi:RNA polymerase sigma-70 factor (ECF subfamily)
MARGDRQALAALYDRRAPTLLAIGMRLLRDRAEAEDVLHDVFLEAWRSAGDYDPRRGSVRCWLYVRMRSRCRDRLKSAAYSRSRPIEGEVDAVLEPLREPGGDGGKLPAALAALSADHRAVLVLAYVAGLSTSEIAARLGIPTGTVKSRTAAAVSRLRERFAHAPRRERPAGRCGSSRASGSR